MDLDLELSDAKGRCSIFSELCQIGVILCYMSVGCGSFNKDAYQ
jgi:hypothetical protein